MRISTRVRWLPILATLVLSFTATRSAAICGEPSEIADARAHIATTCDCAGQPAAPQWRACVRGVLDALEEDGQISRACRREVKATSIRSTCGRTNRIVCCRTDAGGATRASIRRPERCNPPRGGAACISEVPFVRDACGPSGCIVPECGNGSVEPGEECDSPDRATCTDACQLVACPGEGPGALVACHGGQTDLQLDGIASTFAAAFTVPEDAFRPRAMAIRFGSDGSEIDPSPFQVSQSDLQEPHTTGNVSRLTNDGEDFHLTMRGGVPGELGGGLLLLMARRIPVSGPLVDAVAVVASDFPIGSCGTFLSGPVGAAPNLSGTDFHHVYSQVFHCTGDELFRFQIGVPQSFSVPPGVVSQQAAGIAAGQSDVATVWWNVGVPTLDPPMFFRTLRAGWLEPTPTSTIDLLLPPETNTSHAVGSPVLAAAGDVFMAAWRDQSQIGVGLPLDEIRMSRFSRASGVLSGVAGEVVVEAEGLLGEVALASNGARFLLGWAETVGPDRVYRAMRIAPDGTPLESPIDVASLPSGTESEFDVAASSTAELLGLTISDGNGSVAVRVMSLPPLS